MNRHLRAEHLLAPENWHAAQQPDIDYKALLLKYMARVIDIESVAYISEGCSYSGIEFKGAELDIMGDLERQARKEYNL